MYYFLKSDLKKIGHQKKLVLHEYKDHFLKWYPLVTCVSRVREKCVHFFIFAPWKKEISLVTADYFSYSPPPLLLLCWLSKSRLGAKFHFLPPLYPHPIILLQVVSSQISRINDKKYSHSEILPHPTIFFMFTFKNVFIF